MNVSLNWLKQYIDLDINPDELSEILTDIGLEVEGMTTFESIKGGLEGIVAGHVLECKKHPNADKLSLCTVSVGGEENLQIVCGAPNVAADQKVWVATIGTTLYTAEGEAWKIKRGKIRGEESAGMICAEDEIGLGESHAGIMVLESDLNPGTKASDYYKIESDVVYDIGLTPNRSDATSHIGVAEDLAAFLKINKGHSGKISMPEANVSFEGASNGIKVTVENTEACPRYSGVSLSGIKVKSSPEWMQNRLKAIGVRPISNIVDITNYVLHEFGQPLHAFDADKIAGNEIIVKNLKEGHPFVSLDEVERKLSSADLMICDGESNPMCIGGVFGGLNSGVTDSTTNVFLEAAHFNPISIRQSSTRHNLRTDAAKCFEKGSDPNVTLSALKRAVALMVEYADAQIDSDIVDIYPDPIKPAEVLVRHGNVARLIGEDIGKEKSYEILRSMNMEIEEKDEESFIVKVPTNKSDVTREADIIEEILRIYGLNKVAIPGQIKSTISFTDGLNKQALRNTLADLLASNGFNEIMSLSLSQSSAYEEILPIDKSQLVEINNTSNVHLNVMRPEMLLNGLLSVVYNQNRQKSDLKMFEMGRSYLKSEKGFNETEHLCLFVTGKWNEESWHKQQYDSDLFLLKGTVEKLLQRVGLTNYNTNFDPASDRMAYGFSFQRGPMTLCEIGLVKSSISEKMGLKGDCFYADINMDVLYRLLKNPKISITEPSKYPSIRRDLALVLDEGIRFADLEQMARKVDKRILKKIDLFDVYEDKKHLGEGNKSYALSFLFEDEQKTLKDKDIDKLMNKLIKGFESEFGAKVR